MTSSCSPASLGLLLLFGAIPCAEETQNQGAKTKLMGSSHDGICMELYGIVWICITVWVCLDMYIHISTRQKDAYGVSQVCSCLYSQFLWWRQRNENLLQAWLHEMHLNGSMRHYDYENDVHTQKPRWSKIMPMVLPATSSVVGQTS